jgi:uncharacterized protein YmfQ (DUF2313 family)
MLLISNATSHQMSSIHRHFFIDIFVHPTPRMYSTGSWWRLQLNYIIVNSTTIFNIRCVESFIRSTAWSWTGKVMNCLRNGRKLSLNNFPRGSNHYYSTSQGLRRHVLREHRFFLRHCAAAYFFLTSTIGVKQTNVRIFFSRVCDDCLCSPETWSYGWKIYLLCF